MTEDRIYLKNLKEPLPGTQNIYTDKNGEFIFPSELKEKKMKVTKIILITEGTQYKAMLIIDNKFCALCEGNDQESSPLTIPNEKIMYFSTPQNQAEAAEKIDPDQLLVTLEKSGFEQNLGYLQDHAGYVL